MTGTPRKKRRPPHYGPKEPLRITVDLDDLQITASFGDTRYHTWAVVLHKRSGETWKLTIPQLISIFDNIAKGTSADEH